MIKAQYPLQLPDPVSCNVHSPQLLLGSFILPSLSPFLPNPNSYVVDVVDETLIWVTFIIKGTF